MKQILLALTLLSLLPPAQAFSWQDLWLTKNQQAQKLMNSSEYAKAQETYEDPAWQATAAYRAGNYKEAVKVYQSLKNNPEALYNLGNALAQAGQLEPAIKAYNKALTFNPGNKDALHNRKIVEELLKKEQEKQDKKDQNKKDQNKQDQDKQDQDKQDQDKQDQDKQDQDKQNQDKQDQDKQDQDKQDQDKQDQDKQDKQDQDKQDKQDQDKQDQDKQDQETAAENQPQSQSEKEKHQAKEQWLRLIPDDPGGLMREKFLRDYLSRQRSQS